MFFAAFFVGENEMRQNTFFVSFTFCLLMGLSPLVNAAPSMQGSTGSINTPSADVLRPGQFDVGGYHVDGIQDISFATNLAKNWELSTVSRKLDKGDRAGQVNLKYAVKQEGVLTPGLAVGVDDLAGTDQRTVYAVASKGLPLGFRLHVGLGNGRYDGAFAAIEKRLIPLARGGVFPDMSVIVENDGRHMNYGLRLAVAAGLKASAGWMNGKPFVGIAYNYY